MRIFEVFGYDDGVAKIFYDRYLQRLEGIVLFDDDIGGVVMLYEGTFWDLIASIFLVEQFYVYSACIDTCFDRRSFVDSEAFCGL